MWRVQLRHVPSTGGSIPADPSVTPSTPLRLAPSACAAMPIAPTAQQMQITRARASYGLPRAFLARKPPITAHARIHASGVELVVVAELVVVEELVVVVELLFAIKNTQACAYCSGSCWKRSPRQVSLLSCRRCHQPSLLEILLLCKQGGVY